MPTSSRDLLAAARAVVPEVTVDEVHGRARDPRRVLLDVRERYEFEEGHLAGAVHLSKGFWNAKGGYEFNLAILAAVAALALTGPGALSLDSALNIHLPEPATLIVLTIALIAGVAVTLGSRRPAPVAKTETT